MINLNSEEVKIRELGKHRPLIYQQWDHVSRRRRKHPLSTGHTCLE
jgi:hypothetical protein